MKKFLLFLILFALTGSAFAQNNGKLPTINTNTSKSAPKSKMPTIVSAPSGKPVPQTAKPAQKPAQAPSAAPTTATKTAAPEETAVTEAPSEEPSLLKVAMENAKGHESEAAQDTVVGNPDALPADTQPVEPATPTEIDGTPPANPAAAEGSDTPSEETQETKTATPAIITHEQDQE